MFPKLTNWLLRKPVAHDNVVEAKKELRDAIVKYFDQKFFGQKTFTDTVVIWVSDSQQAKHSYVRDKEFETELRAELEDKELKAISKAKFVFRTAHPPQELELIAEGVYIQLIATGIKPPQEIYTRAKITVVKGKGSLMENEYILDAQKQTEYNIGRGVENNNHLVIKENDPVNSELNNCVSRQHAKIVFVAEKGFCLQSRNENNRTIINRNNQRADDLKELNRIAILQDGDEIELGKSVCLKFEVLKEKTKQ
jgi:hypothetical protein